MKRTLFFAPFLINLLLWVSSSAWSAEPLSTKPVFHSWTALRAKDVVLQQLDFSCGAASLATLATFFLGKPTTEEAALKIVRARYTPEEWKKKKQDGLSMEDLAFIAQQLGLKTEGAKVGLAALVQLKGPVIVHLHSGEFEHFSVLRGIRGLTVYLADPALGRVARPLGTFIDEFSGAVLAVWDPNSSVPAVHPLVVQGGDWGEQLYGSVRSLLLSPPQPLGPHF